MSITLEIIHRCTVARVSLGYLSVEETIKKKQETRRKQRCVTYLPRPSSSMIIRDLSLAFYEKEALL